jgi:type I restriction enzyme M protein
MTDIVQKLWGFCHTLRHDGIDYGDYIEQLTYLLFLKMADERGIDLSRKPMKNEKGEDILHDCSWPTLLASIVALIASGFFNSYRRRWHRWRFI